MNCVFLQSFRGFSLIYEPLTILTNVSGTGFVLFTNSAAASPTPRARPDCPGLTKHKKMKFSLWPGLSSTGRLGLWPSRPLVSLLQPDGHTGDIYLSFANLLDQLHSDCREGAATFVASQSFYLVRPSVTKLMSVVINFVLKIIL